MKIRNILLSALAIAVLLTSFLGRTAYAAETTYEDGEYTATVNFYKAEFPDTYSMCNVLFHHTADVTVEDGMATIRIYVVDPIPNFTTEDCYEDPTKGTLCDITVEYDGKTYTAECDWENKVTLEYSVTSSLYGLVSGESYSCEVITVTMPVSCLNTTQTDLYVTAHVNVVMMSTEYFYLGITDVKSAEEEDGEAAYTGKRSMQINATVPVSESGYSVVVPETIAMGDLSSASDNSLLYTVKVIVSDLEGGYLLLSADESGTLSGDTGDTMAFSNAFSDKKVEDEEGTNLLTGTLTVEASAVKSALAGNYTGTTIFKISYYAAEEQAE